MRAAFATVFQDWVCGNWTLWVWDEICCLDGSAWGTGSAYSRILIAFKFLWTGFEKPFGGYLLLTDVCPFEYVCSFERTLWW